MRAFISYSTKDKLWGGHVKIALEGLGVHSFLAHEDMQVSEMWRDRIIEELKEVDIFVAILSSSFKESEWCSQEVGFIISRPDVILIPVAIDNTGPYGFMSARQGKRVNEANDLVPIFSEALFRNRPREFISRQIRKMKDATGFRQGEDAVRPLVPHFRVFTDQEIVDFIDATVNNGEVWDAFECGGKFIPQFIAINWKRIPEAQRCALRSVLENLDYPIEVN